MNHIETMRIALEALQFDGFMPEDLTHRSLHAKAITALRTAIEQAEKHEPVAWINAEKRTFEWNGPVLWNTPTVAVLDKIPLYTTPPAQEFVCSTGLCHFTLTQTNVGIGERGMEAYEAAKERGWVGVSDERLMEMPKQKSEKRECMNCAAFGECNPNNDAGRCGYEPPAAQRQWVGLTDEEVGDLSDFAYANDEEFVRNVEAKLKQKNGGVV